MDLSGIYSGVLELARSTYELAHGAISTATRQTNPDLRALARNRSPGPATGPWTRLADAKWLGPYTPANVPHWVRKLMRRDAQLALGLMAVKSPFFGIEYRAVGGNPTTRAFLDRVLLQSKIFRPLLWSCLNSLDFGYQTHELLWDLADVTFDVDGEAGPLPSVTMPRSYVLRRVKDLDPERVTVLVDAFDEIAAVTVDGVESVTLPAAKVLHVVNQREFDNYLGQSMLDRAYQHWFSCNVQYLLLDRYLEQRGNPPLVGTAPNEVRYDEDKSRDTKGRHCLDVLNEQMVNLRSGGACALPYEVDEKGNPKWKIDVLPDGGRTEVFATAINHREGMKLRALAVPERIATQDTKTGSFAMADVHADTFFGMLEVVKERTLLEPLNDVAEVLQKANFGASTPLARIEGSEISRFKHELLGELVKEILSLKVETEEGFYTGHELVDLPRALEALNVPRRRVRAILKKRVSASSELPGPGGAPVTTAT